MQLCRQGGSPATALQRWLQAFRAHLTEESAADVESAIALLRLGPGLQIPAMSPTPAGPACAAPSGAAPVPSAASSAQALPSVPATPAAAAQPPPTLHGLPAPHETTPTRKRHHDTARPPPQVLCAPATTSQRPSQDDIPAALHAAATPPCEALCSSLLDVVPTAWLQLPMRCQSELPRRSLTLVAAALGWLHSIVEDTRHGVSQRSAAELIIALAPRCLWPEPPREKGQQLPPNARPQLIQQRVQVLYSGNWAELLDPL
eukprot:6468864-Amphidinium_carterae.1